MSDEKEVFESVFGVEMHAIAWLASQVKQSDPACKGLIKAADIERWANGYQPTYTEGFNLGYKLATDHAREAISSFAKRVDSAEE